MLVVGSTVLVRPASDIPYIARHGGAKIIEINTEKTALTPMADIFLQGPSGAVLQRLTPGVQDG